MNFDEQLQLEMDNISAGAAGFMSKSDQKRLGLEDKAKQKEQTLFPERLATKDYRTGRDRPLEQGGSGGIGYSQIDGNNVVNRNKQYNNASPEEMQAFMSYLADNQVFEDPYGNKYKLHKKTGEKLYLDPGIDTGRLYMGPSKTDPNELKVGTSRFGVKERYTPGLARNPDGSMAMQGNQPYGWESGPDGIDPDKAYLNMNLTADMAKKAEAYFHGNTQNIGARKMFDDGSPEAIRYRQTHGSGASEYYDRDKTALYSNADPSTNVNLNRLLEGMGIPANDDGRYYSSLKSIGAKLGNMGENLVDTGTELVANTLEKTGKISKEEAKKLRDKFNSTPEDWEDKLDYNSRFRDYSNREYEAAIANGDYIGAVVSSLKNFDIDLAESAPEMVAIASGVGFGIAINSRVQNQKNEYIKATGREPTEQELALMTTTNAASLLLERIFTVGPLKNIGKEIGKTTKGIVTGKGFQHAGTTLGSKAGKVAGAVGFEAVQEGIDQSQEQFWNKGGADSIGDAYDKFARGDVITKNELIGAAIKGGVMGGTLRGVAETPGITKAAANSYNLHKLEKDYKEADQYLDKEDKEFANLSVENDNANIQEKRDMIASARAELSKAKESQTPLADMFNSKSPLVQEVAKKVKVDHINNIAGSIDYKNSPTIVTDIAQDSLVNPAVQKILGTTEAELSQMPAKQHEKLINDAMSNKSTREKLISSLNEDKKLKIFDDHVTGKELSKVEKGLAAAADEKFEIMDSQHQMRMDNNQHATEALNKSEGRGKKSGKIDFEKSSTKQFPTLKEFLTSPFSRQKTRALNEINKYDTKSIEDAIDIAATPKERKWLQAVLDKRARAKETIGIGGKKAAKVGSKDYTRVSSAEPLGKTKIETIEALKTAMRRTEMEDMAEVSNAKSFIEKAKKAGHITDKQAQILMKRLKKIDAKTKLTAVKNAKKRKNALEKANNARKSFEEQLKEDANAKPKFSADEGDVYKYTDKDGNEHTTDIVYMDDEDIVLDIDGKDITFDVNTGKQIVEIGEEAEYFNGSVYTPSQSNTASQKQNTGTKTGSQTDTDTDTDTGIDPNEKQDDASAEAAMKAALDTIGEDFDPSTLTDEQLDNLAPELKQLFDC